MVIEHALLPVATERRPAFEAAWGEAQPLIAASPGFLGLTLHRPAEPGAPYLLLVEWANVAAHRDGFRRSDRDQRWRALLHPFYDPIPVVGYVEREPLARMTGESGA